MDWWILLIKPALDVVSNALKQAKKLGNGRAYRRLLSEVYRELLKEHPDLAAVRADLNKLSQLGGASPELDRLSNIASHIGPPRPRMGGGGGGRPSAKALPAKSKPAAAAPSKTASAKKMRHKGTVKPKVQKRPSKGRLSRSKAPSIKIPGGRFSGFGGSFGGM